MNTNRFRIHACAALTVLGVLATSGVAGADSSLGSLSSTTTTTTTTAPGLMRSTSNGTGSVAQLVPPVTVAGAPAVGPTSTTSTTVLGEQERLGVQYRSLSAGLIMSYASTAGVDIGQFVSKYGGQIDNTLGTSVMGAGVSSMADLEARIANAGLVPGSRMSGVASPTSLAASIAGAAPSPDTLSVLGNVNLANQLAGISTPALTMPAMGAPRLANPGLVSEAQLQAQPSDSLAFGLFQNQTLAQLATSAPDIFNQVSAYGVTDGRAAAAVATAQGDAQAALTAGVGASLLAPCHAVFMSAMATGSGAAGQNIAPAGSNCSPCAAAGVFLHSSNNRLFNPGVQSSAGDNNGASFNVAEWGSLSQWTRDAIISQSPNTNSVDGLNARNGRAGAAAQQGCEASSAGTSSFLGNNISGLLNGLGG
jgi:hypothetical protein